MHILLNVSKTELEFFLPNSQPFYINWWRLHLSSCPQQKPWKHHWFYFCSHILIQSMRGSHGLYVRIHPQPNHFLPSSLLPSGLSTIMFCLDYCNILLTCLLALNAPTPQTLISTKVPDRSFQSMGKFMSFLCSKYSTACPFHPE